ncbi:hypothetical protein ACQJBY_023384 [Aegilops geniculata]
MVQLATFRQEAAPELEVEREEIAIRASALVEYTNGDVFIPERAEDGTEVPPSWFGLNPDEAENPAEEIASSDEATEEEEDEEGDDIAPDDGATKRNRPDPALASEQRETTSAAADQTGSDQPEAPPAGTTANANPSEQPAVPPA